MLDIDLLVETNGLYRTTFPDLECSFVYRILTLKEYQVFRSLRDGGVLHPWVVATKVFQRCYVGQGVLIGGDLPAGLEVSIGDLIMWLSGDSELDSFKQDLQRHRRKYAGDSVTEFMKRIICTAFPAYRWEELDGWTREQLMERFVVSESILQNRIEGYKPLDLKEVKSPEEMAAVAAKQKQKPAHGIDFKRENAMMRKSMGAWAEDEAKDSQKLSREQLQRLKAKQRG